MSNDGELIKRMHALTVELQQVVRAHGLDGESALGALVPVVASQLEAFLMDDAKDASGTALSRGALVRRAEEDMARFTSAVLMRIAWK